MQSQLDSANASHNRVEDLLISVEKEIVSEIEINAPPSHVWQVLDVASAADSIVNYADSKKADLIVIGTKRRTGLKRLLLGSVASGVVTHASCPVLITR
jgi:nucleotide-binding universal stress UspA family protein